MSLDVLLCAGLFFGGWQCVEHANKARREGSRVHMCLGYGVAIFALAVCFLIGWEATA